MRALRLLLLIAMLPALGGCVAALGAGAGAAGVVALQERSVGQAVDDVTIKSTVVAELMEGTPRLFASIDVEVVEGRVLLTGAVKDPEMRIEAARRAWKVQGVREVINEVQVTDKSGILDLASDTRITTVVVSKLLFDRDVAQVNYSVETVNGVVYIIGVARSADEMEKVNTLARSVGGVKRVVNNAVLRSDPRRR